jgi:hypothetical protein
LEALVERFCCIGDVGKEGVHAINVREEGSDSSDLDDLIGCLASSPSFQSVIFILQLSFDLEQSSFPS